MSAGLDGVRRIAREALAEADATERPQYAYLLGRVESALRCLLDALDAEDSTGPAPSPAPESDTATLAAIRLVLGSFDWETDDRQYALEQIDDILRGER
jgi:hypothetical protein